MICFACVHVLVLGAKLEMPRFLPASDPFGCSLVALINVVAPLWDLGPVDAWRCRGVSRQWSRCGSENGRNESCSGCGRVWVPPSRYPQEAWACHIPGTVLVLFNNIVAGVVPPAGGCHMGALMSA